jgi:hypothetical protein
MAKVWELIMEHGGPFPKGIKKCHLLWALHFKKGYSSYAALAKSVSCGSLKTLEKWIWFFVFEIKELVPEVVSSIIVSANVFVNQMTKLFCSFGFSDCLGEQESERQRKGLLDVGGHHGLPISTNSNPRS